MSEALTHFSRIFNLKYRLFKILRHNKYLWRKVYSITLENSENIAMKIKIG